MNFLIKKPNFFPDIVNSSNSINYLTEEEINRLIYAFDTWTKKKKDKRRLRYWLTFLFLRFTGARVSELIQVDDRRDIDFTNSSIKMPILKQKKKLYKTIPIPEKLITEYLKTVKIHPDLEGTVFHVDRSNFYKCFTERCQEAGIKKELAHPHILRHTRAIEMVRSGVPLTIVQKILGHYSLSNTAVYLQFSAEETYSILKSKNLI